MNNINIEIHRPYSGEPAVYLARAIIDLINDSLEYDDDDACLQQGIFRFGQTVNKQELSISLMPNPADEYTSIILKGDAEGICKIKIFDVTGRFISDQNFNCTEKKKHISTAQFSPGIYKVEVYINSIYLKTSKLIITR